MLNLVVDDCVIDFVSVGEGVCVCDCVGVCVGVTSGVSVCVGV